MPRTKNYISNSTKRELGAFAVLMLLEREGKLNKTQIRRILQTTSRNLHGKKGDLLYVKIKRML